tara:strand:- start:2563 stop:3816 length:1254 start_codon:yes stop_codon:yes gene_type:complete
MALDLAGMLTGVSKQPIDPRLNMQQQQLALGANATKMMQGGMESMRRSAGGEAPVAQQLQMAMSKLDLQNPDDLRKLISIQMATGDRTGAAKTAAMLQAVEDKTVSLSSEIADRTSFADYLSLTYKEEGEAVRDSVMRGTIDSSNFDKFINVSEKKTPKNITYTNPETQEKETQLVFFNENGDAFNEQGASLVLPDDAQITITGRTEQDLGAEVSGFSPKELATVRDDILSSRSRIIQLGGITDSQIDKYLGYLGKGKAMLGRGLGQLTGLGGDAINDVLLEYTGVDLQQFAGEQGVLFGDLERYFNEKKHDVTGAAAAVAELIMLRKGILSGETSPAVAKLKLKSIIDREKASLAVNFDLLRTGGLDVKGYFTEENNTPLTPNNSNPNSNELTVEQQESQRLISSILKTTQQQGEG